MLFVEVSLRQQGKFGILAFLRTDRTIKTHICSLYKVACVSKDNLRFLSFQEATEPYKNTYMQFVEVSLREQGNFQILVFFKCNRSIKAYIYFVEFKLRQQGNFRLQLFRQQQNHKHTCMQFVWQKQKAKAEGKGRR